MSKHGFRSKGRLIVLLATAVTALSACGSEGADNGGGAAAEEGGGSDPVTLRFASFLPESGGVGQGIQAYADRVAELSDGSVTIEIYPSASLLPGTETMKGVAEGRADMGITTPNYHTAELPYWNVVAVPFVTDNGMAAATAFKTLYAEDDAFEKQFDDQGVKVVGFFPLGNSTTGSKVPIENLDYFAQARLRAPGTTAALLGELGADVVYLELVEVYEGLTRGVVDGWAGTDFSTAASLNLGETSPHITDVGVGQYASVGLLINPDVYSGLDEDQQRAIDEAGAEFPEVFADRLAAVDEKTCDSYGEQGATVSALDDAVVEELKVKTVDKVTDVVRDAAPSADDFDAVLSQYTDIVDSYDNPTGYEDGLVACANRE